MRWLRLLLMVSVVLAIPPTFLTNFVKSGMITNDYFSKTNKLLETLMNTLENDTATFISNGSINVEKVMEQVEKFSQLQNGTLSCLSDVAVLLGSSLCSIHQSNILCRENVAAWGLRVLDSWPRLPSGLVRRGPFFFLGDYDSCLELINEHKAVHYCTLQSTVKTDFDIPVTTGVCLPSSCSSEVVASLSDQIISKIRKVAAKVGNPVEYKRNKIRCQGIDHEWPNAKTALMVLTTFVCCLLAGGTLFDYSIRKRPIDKREDAGRETEEEAEGTEDGKHLFNAPSIALTYRSIPDLKKTLATRTVLVDILCAFSIRISMNHLFRNTAREIPVLNGIKVLSAIWVILGHSCLFSLSYIDTVQAMASQPFSSWLSSLLFNSSLSVDTFLFISGAVLAFTVRKRILFRGHRECSALQHLGRLFLFYIHRVARLWPALCISAVFAGLFYNHLGDGPLWDTNGIFGTQCSVSSVVTHLGFVSNFFPSHCLPWLWHISLDFQLYLLSPLFLFILYRKKNLFFILAAILILATLGYRTAVYLIYNLPANMFIGMLKERKLEEGQIAFRLLYGSPLSRSPPFLIGLGTGWVVCVRRTKELPLSVIMGLKCAAFYFLMYSLFAPFSEEGIPSLVHGVLHRTLWSLGLAAVVWLCEHGYLTAVSYFLASPKLLPVARLSLGIYLTHEPILLWLVWSQRQPASPNSFGHFLILTATVTALSVIAAFVFAICFEFPFLNIERRLFKKTERSFNRKKEEGEHGEGQKSTKDGFGEKEMMDFSEKTKLWLSDVDNPYTTICHMNMKEVDGEEVDCEPAWMNGVEEEGVWTEAEKSASSSSIFELNCLSVVEREQLLSSRC